jgi:hypothetical protein
MSSSDHDRPAGVAVIFQRGAHPVSAANSEPIAVLKAAPARSDLADETGGLEVVAAFVAVDAAAVDVG